MNKSLAEYVENEILPFYEKYIGCTGGQSHGIEHVRHVIRRSLEFAEQVKGTQINIDMVYAIAAFHDTGIATDRATHEKIGAQILLADKFIAKMFSKEQRQIMAEAVEDHRASLKNEPRSIYGKIVSSADRRTDIDDGLCAVFQHNIKYCPHLSRDQMIEKSRLFVIEKYGDGGYAKNKSYFDDKEYKAYRTGLSDLAANKPAFKERILKANDLA